MVKVNRVTVLKEMYLRDLLPFGSDLEKEYLRLKAGIDGEMELVNWLKELLGINSTILYDLHFKHFNRTQVDLMVLWDEYWWVIEVKNYDGLFEFSQNENKLRDWRMAVDQLASMRNRLRIVKDLAGSLDPRIQVDGSFMMIHPDGDIKVDSDEKFEILTRNQIKRAIKRRIMAHRTHTPWKIKKHLKALAQFIDPYPEEIPTLTPDLWKSCKKGVRCPECDHYLVESSQKSLKCPRCGHNSLKKNFVIDLFKQLLVLFHNQKEKVNASRLVEFSNHLISRNTICLALCNQTKVINKGPASYYKLLG